MLFKGAASSCYWMSLELLSTCEVFNVITPDSNPGLSNLKADSICFKIIETKMKTSSWLHFLKLLSQNRIFPSLLVNTCLHTLKFKGCKNKSILLRYRRINPQSTTGSPSPQMAIWAIGTETHTHTHIQMQTQQRDIET